MSPNEAVLVKRLLRLGCNVHLRCAHLMPQGSCDRAVGLVEDGKIFEAGSG